MKFWDVSQNDNNDNFPVQKIQRRVIYVCNFFVFSSCCCFLKSWIAINEKDMSWLWFNDFLHASSQKLQFYSEFSRVIFVSILNLYRLVRIMFLPIFQIVLCLRLFPIGSHFTLCRVRRPKGSRYKFITRWRLNLQPFFHAV